eukprot:CAMPEP_0170996422 /NCGR_PEP_ID=MMETSP0736-20130129/12220_1 /TAXON_ID=186038 /ORGANISM="Fragilariopsis kerguelensis, Strain L26-C5" /LENGTH=121 /DNA_ID=CAMNT_0011422849 /DNA_START=265 /DNA_END=628 /DNA_ORIENTATION=+
MKNQHLNNIIQNEYYLLRKGATEGATEELERAEPDKYEYEYEYEYENENEYKYEYGYGYTSIGTRSNFNYPTLLYGPIDLNKHRSPQRNSSYKQATNNDLIDLKVQAYIVLYCHRTAAAAA